MAGEDLSGQRFGSLLVVGRSKAPDRHNRVMWICRCDCGRARTVSTRELKSGRTRYCGVAECSSAGNPRPVWTLRAPDGQTYRTRSIMAFVQSRPQDFPNPNAASVQFVRIAQTLSGQNKCRQNYYECRGWHVVSRSDLTFLEPPPLPRQGTPEQAEQEQAEAKKRLGRARDLTGQRFGTLTALYRIPDAVPVKWRCACDCGGTVDALASNLVQGHTTSCPNCHSNRLAVRQKNPTPAFRDLTGRRFGLLTARFYDRRRRVWVCQCDCGGSCSVASTYLTNGARSDCGCIAAANAGKRIQAGSTGCVDGTNINMIRHVMEGKKRVTNTSGVTGVKVRHNKNADRYRAQIMVQGHTINLGTFDTLDEAAEARRLAEQKYFAPLIEAHTKKDE